MENGSRGTGKKENGTMNRILTTETRALENHYGNNYANFNT